MKETKFIEQNKEKWLKFEQLLRLKKRDPDQLGDLFIQITDDLSYARTNYPNRSIRVYLNNLAQQLFYNIYKNKKEGKNRLVRFWAEELPSITYHCRRELLLAFMVFFLALAIGVVSAANDAEFVRTILGDSYVETTLSNIENDDPMAIYKSANEVDMFLGISFNNVLVAFRTFVTGIFFSLGSIIILMFNGIMVGSFQYFFLERGLVAESMLTIWLHGTLEISSIVIAGGAGIVLGKGFVFPGTHSRLRAFQQSARLGLKLLIGVVPIIVSAAVIESFLTRYTDAPAIIKLTLIIASLAFMLFYFVWLPYKKYKNGTIKPIKDTSSKIDDYSPQNIQGEIYKVNEIFRHAVVVYLKLFKSYFLPLLGITVVIVGAYAYTLKNVINAGFVQVNSFVLTKIKQLLAYQDSPLLFFINAIFFAGITFLILFHVCRYFEYHVNRKRLVIASITGAILVNLPFFINGFLSFLFFIILLPVVLHSMIIYIQENISFTAAMSSFRKSFNISSGRILGLLTLLSFITIVFLFLIDSPFMSFYLDFVESNFSFEGDLTYYVILALNFSMLIIGIGLIFPLFAIGVYLQYFTLREISTADYLLEQIRAFAK
ncbi:stage II sporulation protein M [Fulvivirga sediminis]|uniref:Stage II sporulation protein M n=1 Tax=Fulvivirga sediminis TaxID=2803949 RepID=A0A937F650_9BACT|nr:stage II sporulation protein M [Fulvivirga sediminis]MBL3657137.1 stage II sporulation protein M [Fulvivirga sediminis]